jgi:RNA polymerase sigma-70 factor (ECF subfamily)
MTDQLPDTAPPPARELMSDDTLITRFQTGECDAFRILVNRHRERVRNLVYSILNDSAVVDDLAQDIFLKAYEGLPRFRFDAAFGTWLYRITVNRCRDEIRRKRTRIWIPLQHLLERDDRELAAKTSIPPDDPELRAAIAAAIAALPEKLRVPVLLRDVEGLSYDEIAGVVDCDVGTVKSRLFRGRERLRAALKPLMDA